MRKQLLKSELAGKTRFINAISRTLYSYNSWARPFYFSSVFPTFPLDSLYGQLKWIHEQKNDATRARKRFRDYGQARTRIEVKNTLESNGPALYYARKESKYRGTACRNKKQLRQEEGVCDEVCQVRTPCARETVQLCAGDFVHLIS